MYSATRNQESTLALETRAGNVNVARTQSAKLKGPWLSIVVVIKRAASGRSIKPRGLGAAQFAGGARTQNWAARGHCSAPVSARPMDQAQPDHLRR